MNDPVLSIVLYTVFAIFFGGLVSSAVMFKTSITARMCFFICLVWRVFIYCGIESSDDRAAVYVKEK